MSDPGTPLDAAALDFVVDAAQAALKRMSEEEQRRIQRVLDGAPSELERELLLRTLAAGETALRTLALARALRSFRDNTVARAVSPRSGGEDSSLLERLRAASNPALAYEAQNGPLSPKPAGELSVHPSAVQGQPAASRSKLQRGLFLQDLMNDGTLPAGVLYREARVGDEGMAVASALDAAAQALGFGCPVPVLLGNALQPYLQYALILQVQWLRERRLFQLHEPAAFETLWLHDTDIIQGRELPLTNKDLVRITAIALPMRLTP